MEIDSVNDINSKQLKLERIILSKNFPIPTNDLDVKIMLRDLCEPIIYFGETSGDRRERLRKTVEKSILNGELVRLPNSNINSSNYKSLSNLDNLSNNKENSTNEKLITINGTLIDPTKEEFYIESSFPNDLINFRKKSLNYSIIQSEQRILKEKEQLQNNNNRIEEFISYTKNINSIKKYEYRSTEYVDERGTKGFDIDSSDSFIAIAGVSSQCNIYKIEQNNNMTIENFENNEYLDFLSDTVVLASCLIGHNEKINSIKFNKSTSFSTHYAPHLATASDDNTIKLWSFDPQISYQKSTSLKGHKDKVNDIDFAKVNYYLGSVSNDQTFKIWDLATKINILSQDGHVAPINCLSFQADGALCATGDNSGIGFIWDLRTGRRIMVIDGHTSKITCMNFNSNSYQLATGGDDNTLRIWDLRKNGKMNIIPAHMNTVKSVYFNNDLMLTAGFDGLIKLWSSRDYSLIREMKLDDNRVNCVKMTKNNKYILASCNNKTLKMFKQIN
jgi:U4/U6 small nuclear ribonucleoprotein PRP4